MATNKEQVLLPSISQESTDSSDWFDWLTDPLPKRFMLPATGVLVMGLDWLLFSKEAATLGLAIPFTSVVGFLAGSIGTYHLQRKYGLDTKAAALLKSVLAGVLVGIPFPLAGTLAGAWIMTTSGIIGFKDRLWRARFSAGRDGQPI